MARKRHPEPTQLELLSVMERPTVRIVEQAQSDGENVRGHLEGDTITIGRRAHIACGSDMTSTLIHELLHLIRPGASERWISRREMIYFADDKIRAAAAIRLLNAAFFDVER